jgi:hypothetical protein
MDRDEYDVFVSGVETASDGTKQGDVLDVLKELLAEGRDDDVLAVVEKLVARNHELEERLADLRRGSKKNEGVSSAQLQLFITAVGAHTRKNSPLGGPTIFIVPPSRHNTAGHTPGDLLSRIVADRHHPGRHRPTPPKTWQCPHHHRGGEDARTPEHPRPHPADLTDRLPWPHDPLYANSCP